MCAYICGVVDKYSVYFLLVFLGFLSTTTAALAAAAAAAFAAAMFSAISAFFAAFFALALSACCTCLFLNFSSSAYYKHMDKLNTPCPYLHPDSILFTSFFCAWISFKSSSLKGHSLGIPGSFLVSSKSQPLDTVASN